MLTAVVEVNSESKARPDAVLHSSKSTRVEHPHIIRALVALLPREQKAQAVERDSKDYIIFDPAHGALIWSRQRRIERQGEVVPTHWLRTVGADRGDCNELASRRQRRGQDHRRSPLANLGTPKIFIQLDLHDCPRMGVCNNCH